MTKPLTTIDLTDLATACGGTATRSFPSFGDLRSQIDSKLSDARTRFDHHAPTLPTAPTAPSVPTGSHCRTKPPVVRTNCFPHCGTPRA